MDTSGIRRDSLNPSFKGGQIIKSIVTVTVVGVNWVYAADGVKTEALNA